MLDQDNPEMLGDAIYRKFKRAVSEAVREAA